ncbi:MAG: methyltransferase [Hyphomonadaceae bacterium]
MRIKSLVLSGISAALLAACTLLESAPLDATPPATATVFDANPVLTRVLVDQDDAAKARYGDRNPRDTIEFFGITPGMTVAEVLPGGGWYTKILLPYLGDEGTLIGIDYSIDMWSKFGGFADEAYLESKKTWPETWVANAIENKWQGDTSGDLTAFAFGSRDTSFDGQVDVAFLVRVMHHLNRFNTDEKNYMTEALADTHAMLKPGGILGIVQHRAPEENSDAWANGDNGYIKKSDLVRWVEAAGFELIGENEINANSKDMPTNDDFVWRLPPTLGTSRDNPELRAQMLEIGETDRMTLKFRKR